MYYLYQSKRTANPFQMVKRFLKSIEKWTSNKRAKPDDFLLHVSILDFYVTPLQRNLLREVFYSKNCDQFNTNIIPGSEDIDTVFFCFNTIYLPSTTVSSLPLLCSYFGDTAPISVWLSKKQHDGIGTWRKWKLFSPSLYFALIFVSFMDSL